MTDRHPVASFCPEPPPGGGNWVASCLLGVPDNVDLGSMHPSPLTVYADDQPLVTQVERAVRDADGDTRSIIVKAAVPAGVDAEECEFTVVRAPQSAHHPILTPANLKAFAGNVDTWQLEVDGIDGGLYVADFDAATLEVIHQGPVEAFYRARAPLACVRDENNPRHTLPHAGAVVLDLRMLSGVDGFDIRLSWSLGSSTMPVPYVITTGVRFKGPAGMRLLPDFQGRGWVGDEKRDDGSIATLFHGRDGLLTHDCMFWRIYAVDSPSDVGVFDAGWDVADGEWSPTSLPVTASDQRLPDLSFMHSQCVNAATNLLEDYEKVRATGWPIENDDASAGAFGMRHPIGATYGGQTGGIGIEPWPFIVEMFGEASATHKALMGRMAGQLDRTRLSITDSLGRDFTPDEVSRPFNFTIQGGGMYQAEQFCSSWLGWGMDPIGYMDAQPGYRMSTVDLLSEVFQNHRRWGTIDAMHRIRGVREMMVLAQFYGDPTARMHLMSQANAARWDFYDGGRGSTNPWTQTLRHAASKSHAGMGMDRGREFAWAGVIVATARSVGSDAERKQLRRWCALMIDVLSKNTLEASGPLQVITPNNKEWGYALQARLQAAGVDVPGSLSTMLRPDVRHSIGDAEYPLPDWAVSELTTLGIDRPVLAQDIERALNSGQVPESLPTQTYQFNLNLHQGVTMLGATAGPVQRGPLKAWLKASAELIAEAAWADGAPGPDYRWACAVDDTLDGVPHRRALRTREEVEAHYSSSIHKPRWGDDGNTYEGYSMGLWAAAGLLTGAKGKFGLRLRQLLGVPQGASQAAVAEAIEDQVTKNPTNWLPALAAIRSDSQEAYEALHTAPTV